MGLGRGRLGCGGERTLAAAAAIIGAERARVRGAAAARKAGRWAQIPARLAPRAGAQTGRPPREKAAACVAQATSRLASARGRAEVIRNILG